MGVLLGVITGRPVRTERQVKSLHFKDAETKNGRTLLGSETGGFVETVTRLTD